MIEPGRQEESGSTSQTVAVIQIPLKILLKYRFWFDGSEAEHVWQIPSVHAAAPWATQGSNSSRSTWLWGEGKVKSPPEYIDFWIGWSGVMRSWAVRGNRRGVFRKISFVLFVGFFCCLFWGTYKISRKRNLVGPWIEGDHKTMVPGWKRKWWGYEWSWEEAARKARGWLGANSVITSTGKVSGRCE